VVIYSILLNFGRMLEYEIVPLNFGQILRSLLKDKVVSFSHLKFGMDTHEIRMEGGAEGVWYNNTIPFYL